MESKADYIISEIGLFLYLLDHPLIILIKRLDVPGNVLRPFVAGGFLSQPRVFIGQLFKPSVSVEMSVQIDVLIRGNVGIH